MKFYNLKDNTQVVDYATAVRQGLGRNQGLFFPQKIQPLAAINELLAATNASRYFQILKPFVKESLSDQQLEEVIQNTFKFPAKLAEVDNNLYSLELFHGPTLAFKDFGANFMANCLKAFSDGEKITILTATSGDTGAAVAHAFYGIENIQVVILYPQGKISALQEKMFTTLGGNIKTIAIDGTFDDCQALVKQSFDDSSLVEQIGLNSANSINISRLIAQVCYYFDAVAQLPIEQRNEIVISVPCGNFGTLTAAIIAKLLGLPIKRFVATTNVNDTVPRFLQTGQWQPNKTIPTLSNAMDVSAPNNWPRIEYMMQSGQFAPQELSATAVSEEQTQIALKALYAKGYTSEPHAAVAYQGLMESKRDSETGIFLGTAHPAKFKSSVDDILALDLPLPKELEACVNKDSLSVSMQAEFSALKNFLTQDL